MDRSESGVNPARLEMAGENSAINPAPTSTSSRDPAGSRVSAAPGYAGSVLAVPDAHLIDYVKIVYKRRWAVLTIFLVVFVSTVVYSLTATPIYQAKVTILIEKENANVVNFKEAYEQNQVSDDYYQTQYKLLQSRSLVRRTIDAMHVWDDPRFAEKSASGHVGTLAILRRAFESLTRSAKSTSIPDTDETAAQSKIIDQFTQSLTISPVRNSRLVEVSYESSDPVFATKAANELATNYIQQNLEFKFLSSKEASDWLGERLADQRKQVEASEQALQRYREQTDAVALEDKQNIVVQKLADLNAAVTRAKTDRLQKEAAYVQIRSVQNDRASLDTIPAILANGFIQQQKSELADLQRQQAQLSEKLGPNHPDMVKLRIAIQTSEAKIQGEIGKVVQAMKNDYEQALAQERNLAAALDQQKRDALALNRKGIEYGVLQRDAASNRQIFESLLQRTKETGISGELRTSNIRIIDAAEVPRTPARPNVRLNVSVSFIGGLTLAIALAFFFEYIDSHIKTPDEIKQHLALPYLGMVPALFDEGKDPMINNGVPAYFSESFRLIRTNVLFSSAEESGRSLVVTSTGPGEGKTLVASNLSIALAQSGQRVLLLDADMRKPRVHTLFNKSQQPGLSNVLVGDAKASESVQSTSVAGLWVLPAGVSPPNPAELLGSKRFRDFLISLAQHFDMVVMDTPPVMAVTDSAVAAHLATGVVYVVGAEMTSRHAAQRALEQLDHARAKFIGAILNRVDLQHNAYYYSQYYRPEYASYYHQST